MYITFIDPVGVNGGIKDKRPCMHIKKKRRVGRKERRKQKAETGLRRKVHSKCKKITIYVREKEQESWMGV